MPKLVLKDDHRVEITHILETMPVLYPIQATRGADVWEYTGGESIDIYDEAQPVEREGGLVFLDREGNEYLEREVERVED